MRELDRALRALAEDQHALVTVAQATKLGADAEALKHRVAAVNGSGSARACCSSRGAANVAAATARGDLGHRFGGGGVEAVGRAVARVRGLRPRSGGRHQDGDRQLPVASGCGASQRSAVAVAPDDRRTHSDDNAGAHGLRSAARVAGGARRPAARRLSGARHFTLRAFAALVEEIGGHGVAGTAVARRLLDERGNGYVPPESELEALAFEVLAAGGLPAPERQVWLGSGRGYGDGARRLRVPVGAPRDRGRQPALALVVHARRRRPLARQPTHGRRLARPASDVVAAEAPAARGRGAGAPRAPLWFSERSRYSLTPAALADGNGGGERVSETGDMYTFTSNVYAW